MKAYFPLLICLLIACTENREAAGEGNGTSGVEQVAGEAIFYDTIAGNSILNIREGVYLSTVDLENDWILGEFVLTISKENYESAMLREGDSLRNSFDESIGIILRDFPIWKTGVLEDEYVGVIRAFTQDENLLSLSILERSLEMSLESGSPTLDDLESFIVDHRLKFSELYPGYQSYFQAENEMLKEFPGYRMILIFSAQDLVGIVHSRKLNLSKFESQKTSKGLNFSFSADLAKDQKESIIQAF